MNRVKIPQTPTISVALISSRLLNLDPAARKQNKMVASIRN